MRKLNVIAGVALIAQCFGSAAELRSQNSLFRFRDVAVETGFRDLTKNVQGHGAGWGDVDGDGWADLYIGTFHYAGTQPNLLLHFRDGKFFRDSQTALRISTRATGVLLVDLDNDGDLDLYVGSMPAPAGSRKADRLGYPLRGCALFRNDGGTFVDVSKGNVACPVEFGGRSATTLDYNGDGLLDLLVGEEPVTGYSGSQTRTSRLFRNLGALKFKDVTHEAGIPTDAAGLGVAAADLNGDSWPDIFLASTLGNYLLINNQNGSFHEPAGARETFQWPDAKGDNMVCGVAVADINRDGLSEIVLGQHFDSPWKQPVANRVYSCTAIKNGDPVFRDITDALGIVPLPMKSPHVEFQDFDNDGHVDLYTSVVKFADGRPHPVIFRNSGTGGATPVFREFAMQVNDFPTDEDRAIRRSGAFFEKVIADRKIIYSAPGPTCDFDQDGRLDIVMPGWWPEAGSLLMKNESHSGHWLDVRVRGSDGLNAMGIGCVIRLYEPGHLNEADHMLGCREISTGGGYASSQQAIAHFGLGQRTTCDLSVTLPHGHGTITRNAVRADRRLVISAEPSE